jgi:hypothetical protein
MRLRPTRSDAQPAKRVLAVAETVTRMMNVLAAALALSRLLVMESIY